TIDLNDPNNTLYPTGVVGLDSKYGFRLSGSYLAPGDILIAGSFISNGGAAIQSNYSASRAAVASVVNLTRGSQTVFLSERGTERLPHVNAADVRISRPFQFGADRRLTPQ